MIQSGDGESAAIAAHRAYVQHHLAESEALFRRAVLLEPSNPQWLGNYLHLLWLNGKPSQGVAAFEQARAHLQEAQLPWRNLGNLLRDLNDFEAAERVFAQAMQREAPLQQADTAWNRSQVLIGLERYDEAYALSERRFQVARHRYWRPLPHWVGWPADASDLTGLQVCVWSEQGYGDNIQYLRWAAELIRRGATVRLELFPPLVLLARQGLGWLGERLSVVPKGCGPSSIPTRCQGSLLSLPHLLGGVPLAEGPPYLRSPLWPLRPGTPDGPARIGLVWASGRKQGDHFVRRDQRRRSLQNAALRDLVVGLAAEGAELVNLQFGPDREAIADLQHLFRSSLPETASFAEAAAWIASLDLVITVDTATAHQVGAMGVPGWVLLPWSADPRWLRGREDSPWYPSLTLLRQAAPADWSSVVGQVLLRFRAWQARHRDR